ncbi:DnaA regulatory inactivator Hda [Methylomarinum sp. Ch1-1]|uniref:DnaA regulatory inactivator Hda n=1 Tax=Methylomarinum roseum TaxID=3067653 RepID=A0AAU7NV64_9GAMM|nr:DnaA regulatory inactivator Hda [Methylomarinum sp. Ch1-1]MDP4519078.1 DnaA regulatory inactivator Hda [Methylomarinum sp. Ch1-1]
MAEQLPLQFEFQTNQNFASFFPGNNAEVIKHLHDFVSENKEQQIFLWGESGLGKTHLLQACCQSAREQAKNAFYLSFHADKLPDPGLLDGLENLPIVCLDNIEQIAGDQVWEHALFNFYNRHRDHDNQLLITANCPPSALPLLLPDLKTRMSWGLTLKLQALSDEQTIQALSHKAKCMGFDMTEKVGRFLLSHYARDLPALWRLLEKIDQATLAAKRKLTIPFLKQIMTDHDAR